MKTRPRFAMVGVCLLTAVATVPVQAQAPKPAADNDALARKLVHDSARVKEGDMVLIAGAPRDIELLENLATEVRKVGAYPLVQLNTERLGQLYFSKVPAKYDSQERKLDLQLVRMFNVSINVDSSDALDAFASVPPERVAAVGKAFEPVGALALKEGVRAVNVGNDLYPTSGRARLFGVSREELARSFWEGVNVDYAKLQATAQAGIAAFAGGKAIHITNPNGTDLKARIEGRSVLSSDGVISEEDVKKGGAACQVWLPAGEVFLSVVPGTAEGKVVVERQFFQGKEIAGLTLVYKAGKLASMTARSGLEPLKALYDAAGPGKDSFGAIDIGINPNVRHLPGSRMVSWVPAGMVTLTLGTDSWAGGDNGVSFGLNSYLPGSTLKVDGKTLVEAGALRF